jgi:hypothetical protein
MSALLGFLREREFLAAWVQALLSALTILIAYELGLRQSRNQHRSAMRVAKMEQRLQAISFLETIVAITNQVEGLFCDAQKNDDAFVMRFYKYAPIELDDLVQTINAVPLHEIPLPVVSVQLLELRKSLRQIAMLQMSFTETIQKGEFNLSEGDSLDLRFFMPAIEAGVKSISAIQSAVDAFKACAFE